MSRRITVVVSQGQSQNPKKRAVEEAIVAGLIGERGIDVTVVPHLYDLPPDGTGMLCLAGISGPLVVCSWLYPRAARWILDRNGIRGREGQTLIKAHGESAEDDELSEETDSADDGDPRHRVIDHRELPDRPIFCLDLRTHDSAEEYLREVRRIAAEQSAETVELMSWINGSPRPEQLQQYLTPESGVAAAGGNHVPTTDDAASGQPLNIVEDAERRWYPVIDFSRCTNCLECIDFCLFGVYGIDQSETILVEQPDNCRKGCPACSRVCPENAIIFPQHKTPTIAGSPEFGGTLKIDLSKLFGAPDPGAPGAEKAVDVAVQERDEQLLLAGRDAVGVSVGVPKRQAHRPSAEPSDDLDQLIDDLDALDL